LSSATEKYAIKNGDFYLKNIDANKI